MPSIPSCPSRLFVSLTGLLLGSSISTYSMMICPANFSAVASRSLSADLYWPLRSE